MLLPSRYGRISWKRPPDGYRGLVKEIVTQLKKRLGSTTEVFTTGGQAKWILKGLPGIDHHVPHLTLAGLYHLWFDGKGSR